ncbi:TIGR02678 family protein [Actinokineospora pegani]|uniref:TIGR02678 family protein n=1 Tax=Actinokineospora pegani TaxID=2654637 RepID=UPI0012EA64BD|nr:TIGR02678 family protein [Actinokineospora pegani]
MRADTRSRLPTALDDLSDIDAANVARCAKVLLRHPLLRVGGPDGDLLPLVYRHRVPLQEMFATLLGYRLVVERRFARLHKVGPDDDPTRGEAGLTPRGYAYLCLAAAALTGAGRQVLLSRLVADIRSTAAEAGIALVDDLAERRSLTAALRHLVGLGVITETDGAVSEAEALITVHTDLLAQLLGPSAGETSSTVEHEVRRMLVENPVTLHADLTPEQADWLRRGQRRESVLLERCFGLVTEIRAEGVAVTDPEEYLTDVVFPGPGTVARMTLLALPDLLAVAQAEPRSDGRVRIGSGDIRRTCERLIADYPAAWSRQATENIHDLVDAVIDLLRRLALAAEDHAGLLLSPAAHRWLPQPDDTPARAPAGPAPVEEPGWSLFDGQEGSL